MTTRTLHVSMFLIALIATTGVHVAMASLLNEANLATPAPDLGRGSPTYTTMSVLLVQKAGDKGASNTQPAEVTPAQKTSTQTAFTNTTSTKTLTSPQSKPKLIKKEMPEVALKKHEKKSVKKLVKDQFMSAINQTESSQQGTFDPVDAASKAGSMDQQNLSPAFTHALLKRLAEKKSYPFKSRLAKQEGVTMVSFGITGKGVLDTFKIFASSGFSELDNAVVRLFNKAFPLPGYVTHLAEGQATNFTLPISFSLSH